MRAKLLEPPGPPVVGRAKPGVSDDDAQLVARALCGDRWAEDAIYRRHAPSVTRLCTRALGRRDDADDAVQDTFVVAFEKLSSLRDPSALRAWLMRIAVRRVRRLQRRRRWLWTLGFGRAETDHESETPLAHEHARPDLRLELKAVEVELSLEPEERRLAWLLHRVESFTLRETASAMGMSLATIKRYVSAVDTRLARTLGDAHD